MAKIYMHMSICIWGTHLNKFGHYLLFPVLIKKFLHEQDGLWLKNLQTHITIFSLSFEHPFYIKVHKYMHT